MQHRPSLWQTLCAAPHRLFFFAGTVQALLVMLWWLADMAGRYAGWIPVMQWQLAAADAHALLMIFTLFPCFMFGFLMTTYPRWMQGEDIARSLYSPAATLMMAGALTLYPGLLIGKLVLAGAMVLLLAGWGTALYALLAVYFRARHPDKRHAAVTSVALSLGWLQLAAFASGHPDAIAFAKTGGIWLLLLPIFFTVSHRMIPFFSANVIKEYDIVRPYALLWSVLLLSLLHALFEYFALPAWSWMADLPMAIIALYLSWRWRLLQSLATPLLAMLHIAFAWLGIAMLMYATQSLVLLFTGEWILARAPLHALGIGFFGSMLLAMASRVTLGHSGRQLAADRTTWRIFLLFQCVALLRVVADFAPLAVSPVPFYLTAALLWLLCFAVWSAKYGVIYLRPREDGRPG